MPRRRAKSRNEVQQDFFDAIDRLKDGRPQHPDLREKLRRGKAVKISFLTVAQEAGRARGLISKENCQYPEVRQRLLLETGETSSTCDEVIANLRAQVAELRVHLKQAEAHAAYHFAKRTKAERDAAFKQKYERLQSSSATKQRQTARAEVIPLFSKDSEDPGK